MKKLNIKKKYIFLLLAAFIIWGVHSYRSKVDVIQPPSVWVQATVVKPSSLPVETTAIGTLVARSTEVTPEVAGHVVKILFQDGAYVTQGTPLIQLDDAIAKTKYAAAQAKFTYSKRSYKRLAELGKRGIIAQQSIDQAEADYKEDKAAADESAVMLSKMQLKAPFDGMVGKCKVSPGDYVTTGQSIVTLTDTKHLHIEYNVPEKFLPLLKKDQEVKITTAAYPNKIFKGHISFISPTISAENRSIFLYADVPNEKNLLAAGMFVNVIQSLGNKEHTLMIPVRSIVPMLNGDQVFKVIEGKAIPVNVLIGRRTENEVEILQGLTEGDSVITAGQQKIRNGSPVKIKQEA